MQNFYLMTDACWNVEMCSPRRLVYVYSKNVSVIDSSSMPVYFLSRIWRENQHRCSLSNLILETILQSFNGTSVMYSVAFSFIIYGPSIFYFKCWLNAMTILSVEWMSSWISYSCFSFVCQKIIPIYISLHDLCLICVKQRDHMYLQPTYLPKFQNWNSIQNCFQNVCNYILQEMLNKSN